jgi:hypothetical protein
LSGLKTLEAFSSIFPSRNTRKKNHLLAVLSMESDFDIFNRGLGLTYASRQMFKEGFYGSKKSLEGSGGDGHGLHAGFILRPIHKQYGSRGKPQESHQGNPGQYHGPGQQ